MFPVVVFQSINAPVIATRDSRVAGGAGNDDAGGGGNDDAGGAGAGIKRIAQENQWFYCVFGA